MLPRQLSGKCWPCVASIGPQEAPPYSCQGIAEIPLLATDTFQTCPVLMALSKLKPRLVRAASHLLLLGLCPWRAHLSAGSEATLLHRTQICESCTAHQCGLREAGWHPQAHLLPGEHRLKCWHFPAMRNSLATREISALLYSHSRLCSCSEGHVPRLVLSSDTFNDYFLWVQSGVSFNAFFFLTEGESLCNSHVVLLY